MSTTNTYCGSCGKKVEVTYDNHCLDPNLQFENGMSNHGWHRRTWGLNGHIKQWFCSKECGDRYKIGYFQRVS